jgi:hypothetical protein
MIVLVNLKEGVAPEEYERWLEERYVPAILDLASVDEWHGYRVGGFPESGGEIPYEYVVSVGINDLEQLGKDMESAGATAPGRTRPVRRRYPANERAFCLSLTIRK